jgi:ElaB/YqjD/DUF883 family membrane-anchored ribosome-binding protein
MDALERESNEQSELRKKLDAAIDNAKAVCEQLQERTAVAAKATDQTIRDHPYEAIAVAFGVGLLLGMISGRRRYD